MKHILGALILSVASTSVLAVDGTRFFSVYAGGGSWTADYSGELGDFETDLDELGYDDERNTYFYIALEHGVPVLPNIRVESIDVSSSGVGTLTDTFQIGDEVFTIGSEVSSEIDLSFFDAVLYYEVAVFDFGITLRQFDAEASAVADIGGEVTSDSEKVDGVLPLVYLQAKIDLPFTGFYVMGDLNTISYDDKSLIDYSAAIGYGIELSILAELGLEAGYRSFAVDVGDEDDFAGDIELDGPYFGLSVKF